MNGPFLKAYFDLTGRNQNAVSEPASVCGIIPARSDTDQLHPLVDRCPAAAAHLHIGGMLHGVAREAMGCTEPPDAGSDLAVGYRKPFVLGIADTQDPVILVGVSIRD